jgi:hypothetical protein
VAKIKKNIFGDFENVAVTVTMDGDDLQVSKNIFFILAHTKRFVLIMYRDAKNK